MAEQYEAVTEDEWKTLATTEITHLTDEEEDYLPHAWDEWIARVRRDAAREALDGLAATHDAQALAHFGLRNASRIGQEARIYRATHYPETEDQA